MHHFNCSLLVERTCVCVTVLLFLYSPLLFFTPSLKCLELRLIETYDVSTLLSPCDSASGRQKHRCDR